MSAGHSRQTDKIGCKIGPFHHDSDIHSTQGQNVGRTFQSDGQNRLQDRTLPSRFGHSFNSGPECLPDIPVRRTKSAARSDPSITIRTFIRLRARMSAGHSSQTDKIGCKIGPFHRDSDIHLTQGQNVCRTFQSDGQNRLQDRTLPSRFGHSFDSGAECRPDIPVRRTKRTARSDPSIAIRTFDSGPVRRTKRTAR